MRVALAFVLIFMLAVPGDLGAGEPDMTVAAALLDSANEQLRKRNYDTALALIEKALDEAPSYLAALELKGELLEKLGRNTEAAAAYQAWLDAYAMRSAAGTLDKADARRKRVIEKRFEHLTEASRNLAKIVTALETDLEAFIAEWGESAPQVVDRARNVLDATRSLGTGQAEPELPEGTMSRIYRELAPVNEVDLVARKSLGSPAGITYPDDGGMVLTYTDGGTIVQPVEKIAGGTAYVVELHLESRPDSGRWLTGLVFGIEGSLTQFFAAFLKGGKLILHRVADGGSLKEDVAVQRADIKPGSLHVLTVVVDELSIEVYVDEKKRISYTAPRTHDLSGGIGVWAQDIVVRAPQLRLGRLER